MQPADGPTRLFFDGFDYPHPMSYRSSSPAKVVNSFLGIPKSEIPISKFRH